MVRKSVLFYVNGKRRLVSGVESVGTLLSYLRYTERLTGAKLGCGEGGCGACTVMLSFYDGRTERIHHRAVNACLVPVAACDGTAITTVEAVGDRNGNLHPIQLALVKSCGTQCGFCTPGIVMSMYAMIREKLANPECSGSELTQSDVEMNFDGNLCRCTGYRPILDAFKGLLVNEEVPCCRSDVKNGCCGGGCGNEDGTRRSVSRPSSANPEQDKKPSADTSKDFVFPSELIGHEPDELDLCDGKWLRPTTLERLIVLKCRYPDAHLVVGNTELGIDTKFKNLKVRKYLCVTNVSELSLVVETETAVKIGAAVTWSELSSYIEKSLAKAEKDCNGRSMSYKLRSLKALNSQLRRFAGKQIRNVASVGGNIVTASPISDINPVWVAAGACFVMLNCKTKAQRKIIARNFFLSYREVDMMVDEILLCIELPWNLSSLDFTHAFKISRRQEDDIAIVSAGVRILLRNSNIPVENCDSLAQDDIIAGYDIASISIAMGGLAPKTVTMHEVESVLKGRRFSMETLSDGLQVMERSAALSEDVPGGMSKYRQCLALGVLLKAFMITSEELHRGLSDKSETVFSGPNCVDVPGEALFWSKNTTVSRGIQILPGGASESPLCHTGISVPHSSAHAQVSGEAKYLDDMPRFAGELQAALVLSTEAHADILEIDYSVAENMSGVFRVIRYDDVKGENMIGEAGDEFCFAKNLITTMGQVIAIVTAESLQEAKEAAAAVRIEYKILKPVVTIEEALAARSFAPEEPDHTIEKGNTSDILKDAEREGNIIHGCVRIGAQEHWYLEPQGSIAVPEENDEMMIFASTQTPSKTQAVVARVLGVPMHKIVCKVKRIGGGFGGKETRSFFISAAAAVAAQATSRPVRLVLDRDTDMLTTGTRHAFFANYVVAYEPNGRITAIDLKIFLNMGNSFDLSLPVLDRCMFHVQNCYDIDNMTVIGKACLTNSASSTAFRGFGGPQGMMIAETIVEHVSHAVKKPAVTVRGINMYGINGNSSTTPFGMTFDATPLVRCWEEVLSDSTYDKRRAQVEEFNTRYSHKKRGLAAVPTMFGISFTFKTFNQAAALVHIFHQDGSVLVSHGGVEMGQGLHTKMCQIAATDLRIPLSKVFISETSTDKVPNASPTAASASSDMYGMAVRNACRQLLKNLEPFRSSAKDQSWEELVHTAWFNRVTLSATGFYKTPELDQVNLAVPGSKGRPYFYYTNGAAVCEVEIDTLTGEMDVLRTDIVMDVGRPLNPAIDIGQIEGGFVQGLGWCTMEEVVRGSGTAHKWLKPGKVQTLGPSTYKIPGFRDIPKEFHVRILESRNEQSTIHSSKGIGEPPLFLAASVFFAIRDAIAASRHKAGRMEWFELDSPASVERVRLLCINETLSDQHLLEGCRPSLSL